jgi:hypothetical protein
VKRVLPIALLLLCLTGCMSAPHADFVVTRKPIATPIAGFGACMNPYLYAFPNTPNEISPQAMSDLEQKVKALRPQFVRIFFLQSWWDKDVDTEVAKKHPGMRDSFIRTVRLAQEAGASVLIQLWYDPNHYKDTDAVARNFAQAIREMRTQYGFTSIRFATIQNEPDDNKEDVTPQRYVAVYRAFDRALRNEGIRGDIKLIAGDTAGEKWQHWLTRCANELAPVIDGYSIHAYWDYWRIGTFRYHLKEAADLMAKLPAKQRRPIYITEFGARGFREKPSIEPGKSADGRPLADVPVYSFEIGIFMLDAVNLGFVGTSQWDMYDVWYDRKMGYGVIGPVEKGFPLKPGYWLLSMFTHAVDPGWRAMKIDGDIEDIWIAALESKTDLSVFVLNRVNGEKRVTVGGLPRGKTLEAWVWNGDGRGMTVRAPAVPVDGKGVATVTVPKMAILLVTTRHLVRPAELPVSQPTVKPATQKP